MAQLIFVIEDEQDIRDSLAEAIESEGYCTLTAPNGREAMELFSSDASPFGPLPDLILLDLMMPKMNGAKFLEYRKNNARLANIPVILMSADNETEKKATLLGADGHLKKPLELDDLFSTIAKHCKPC